MYLYVIALMVHSLIEVLYRRATGTRWTGRKVLEGFGDYCAHKICLIGEGEAWLLSDSASPRRTVGATEIAAGGLGDRSAHGNACQSMRHPRVCTAVGHSGADQPRQT